MADEPVIVSTSRFESPDLTAFVSVARAVGSSASDVSGSYAAGSDIELQKGIATAIALALADAVSPTIVLPPVPDVAASS